MVPLCAPSNHGNGNRVGARKTMTALDRELELLAILYGVEAAPALRLPDPLHGEI